MNKKDIEDLYKGKCLITFRETDGSEVQCVATLNEELLKNLALDHVDGIVDLISRKIIPTELFLETKDVFVEYGKEPHLSLLDETFQNPIKRRWETP